VGIGIEEEYSPKRGMGTGMENILDGGQEVLKYPPIKLGPVDIPSFSLRYQV
jgi:hypothetical protein